MRLRLVIKRNELPTVKILHHIPIETTGPITVSRLLEDINAIVPLESDIWGLEHYVVQDAEGYECLHFDEVSNVLSDGQEVVVRPMQAKEFKARKVAGRDQLSTTGVHLYDGVPFGRNWTRQRPDRPTVNIPPPRKRLKMTHEEEEEDEEMPEVDHDRAGKRVLRIMDRSEAGGDDANGEQEDDDDDDDDDDSDEDYNSEEDSSSEDDSDTDSDSNSDSDEEDTAEANKENSSSKATDKHTNQNRNRRQGSLKKNTSSPDGDNGDETDFAGFDSPRKTASSAQPQANHEDHERKDVASDPAHSISPVKQPRSAPGEGKRDTRARNERRALHRLLEKRKKKGLEEQDLTITQFRQMVENGERVKTAKGYYSAVDEEDEHLPYDEKKLFEIRREALYNQLADGGVDIDRDQEILNGRRNHNLLSTPFERSMEPDVQPPEVAATADDAPRFAVAEVATDPDGIGNGPSAEPESMLEQSLQSKVDPSKPAAPIEQESAQIIIGTEPVETSSSVPDAKARRSKVVDTAATRRLLFGALGVRNPKTKADEERVRTRLDNAGNRKPITTPSNKTSALATKSIKIIPTAENNDLDAWKRKIRLTAVECVDEDVVLSTPPFPFVQRWDPSQQLGPRGKKRKRKSRGGSNIDEFYEADESQFTYEEPEIQLNYDDEPLEYAHNDVSQPSTITTHMSAKSTSTSKNNPTGTQAHMPEVSQLSSVLAEEAQDDLEDDLPLLPSDPSTLSNLLATEVKPGAVIAFKRLEMSEATNWQPVMSAYVTASVQGPPSSGLLLLRLAKRDRIVSERKYDEETGERIYGKFEMVGDDDDEEEDDQDARDGLLTITFSELMEPKLVKAASELAVQNGNNLNDGAGSDSQDAVVEDSMVLDPVAALVDQGMQDPSGQIVQDSMGLPPLFASTSDTLDPHGMDHEPQAVDITSQNFIAFDTSSSSSPLSGPPPSSPGRIVVEDSQIVDEGMDDVDGDDDAAVESAYAPSVESAKSRITVVPRGRKIRKQA